MAIDIEREQGISFGKAAKMFPPLREGRPVSPSTIWRWARDGARLRDGRRFVLESIRVGSRHMTTVEAVRRFLAAMNGGDAAGGVAGGASPTKGGLADRKAVLAREERELAAMGVR